MNLYNIYLVYYIFSKEMSQLSIKTFFKKNDKEKKDEKDEKIKLKVNQIVKDEKIENKDSNKDKDIHTKTEIKTETETKTSEFLVFINRLASWKEALSEFVNSDKMKKIFNFIEKEYHTNTCYPPKDLIFSAFQTTSWEEIKVVIIGQDPYFNEGEANGLCFSVNKNIKIPPSLLNIYKALLNEKLISKIPSHGDLSSWAKQGVLLLNSTLTVVKKNPNSHQKLSGWEEFTDNVIKVIDSKKKGVVFLLWGGFAKNKKNLLSSGNSYVIENIHPSPMAQKHGDFKSIPQFTKVNEYLKENHIKEINWSIE